MGDKKSYLSLEVGKDFDDSPTYNDLLNTKEWDQKRTEIIKRDKEICCNCGLTKSVFCENKHISIDTTDYPLIDSITKLNIPLTSYKEEFGIDLIDVMELSNLFFGVSKQNLFIVNFNEIDQLDIEKLVVNSVTTQKGRNLNIITPFNSSFIDYKYSVPILINRKIFLQVHHKYYIEKYLPWDYEENVLVTLCNNCHKKVHQETAVQVYIKIKGELIEQNYTPCERCNGLGNFEEFSHVQGGTCFRCNGWRFEEYLKK